MAKRFKLLWALASLAFGGLCIPAHAETVVYSLSFAPSQGSAGSGGTGTLTLDLPSLSPGQYIDISSGNNASDFVSLVETIDGKTFTQTTFAGVYDIGIQANGTLNNISSGITANGLTLNLGGLTYNIYDSASFYESGTFTVTSVAAVPEPSTWAMMLFGFAGIVLFERIRRAHSVGTAARA